MNQFTLDLGEGHREHEFTIAVGEQPPQRLEHFGPRAVSDTELLALLLQGNGTRTEEAITTASRILSEAGSLTALISWEPSDYRRVRGIGKIKGLQLSAMAEIARRMMATPRGEHPLLDRPERIAAHLASTVAGLTVEKFWVLLLNRKNRLVRQVEITSGTATAALAHPREVFRAALRESAPVTALACAHNHPSGNPEPSAADMHVTRLLREASKAVDIELIDHVIVGRPESDPTSKGFYSFRAAGLL